MTELDPQPTAGTAPAPTADLDDYFAGSEDAKATGLYQVLSEDGSVAPARIPVVESRIGKERARAMFRGMLTIRVMDERLLALQRQGRIGFYGEARGQEAAVIGSAAAMEREDWLVPALREAGAGVFRGLSLQSYIAQIFGNDADVSRGRQMPCHPCDRENHYVVMSSCVGSQIPHAVGIAWGMKARGDAGRVCVGYMGDGATSEADFHVALNFAGVFKAPVVLICQNNQWAISTPTKSQTASVTYAIKGLGYGIESLRVDGNDAFAVYLACKYACDKARRGGGPTFLELLTYRVGAHSSSDDPSRYRDESVTQEWLERRDPVGRLAHFMKGRGWLAAGERESLAATIEAQVREVIAAQEQIGPPPLESLVEDVFEHTTWLLREQFDALARYAKGA